MQKKLTLEIDQNLIERARLFARKKKSSLSRLVSDYLRSLVTLEQEEEIRSPVLNEISGILQSDKTVDAMMTDYRARLEKKYQ